MSMVQALMITKGNAGSACTCVVTEFLYQKPDQERRFHCEILLYDIESIRTMLKEHLEDYRLYEKECLLSENEGTEDMALAARTAKELFLALFSDRDELCSEEAQKAFLCPTEVGPEEEPVDIMVRWIEELCARLECRNNVIIIQADCVSSLAETLERFVSTIEPEIEAENRREPALWPIVRRVR